MTTHLLRSLAEYNNHANRVLLNAASRLTPEQFENTSSPSRESIRALLVHLFIVEKAYYARCRGDQLNTNSDGFSTFSAIKSFAESTANDMHSLISSAIESDFDREITATFGEQTLHLPMWQMLLHTFMHTARHRGELSILLSQVGQPLPIPDLIVQYVDESGQVWPFERE